MTSSGSVFSPVPSGQDMRPFSVVDSMKRSPTGPPRLCRSLMEARRAKFQNHRLVHPFGKELGDISPSSLWSHVRGEWSEGLSGLRFEMAGTSF